MNTFEAIYQRRSIRTFVPEKPIPQDIVTKILDSARWAPRPRDGVLPWKLIVVKERSTKLMLADFAQEVARCVFGGSFEIFSEHLWYMPLDTRLRVAEYTTTGALWRYPQDASVVIIPVLSHGGWVTGLSGHVVLPDLLSAYLGAASENMWLAAVNYGVGAAYNAMPVLDERRREILADHLGLPLTWQPTGAFCFGYPPTARLVGPSRGPLEGVTFSESWGNNYEREAFTGKKDFPPRIPDTDLIQTIENLREVKSFQKGSVEPWMMERILDSAVWSPNPENTKHWRFVVVRDEASKEFLYNLVKDKIHTPLYFMDAEAQYAKLWYLSPEERLQRLEEQSQRGIGEWYLQADALIIVVSAYFNWIEQPYLIHIAPTPNQAFPIATGCALQNMMLAATALGLGVNFDPTPVIDPRHKETFCDYFNIPPSWFPLGVLSLGKAGDKIDQPPAPPLQSLVFDEYWGNPPEKGGF